MESVTFNEEVLKIEIIRVPSNIELIYTEIEKYDWNTDIAKEIILHESTNGKRNYNPEWHEGCQGSYGPMQVACIHHRENPEALLDIAFNVKTAYSIYEDRGWNAWGVCHDGKVDCGL